MPLFMLLRKAVLDDVLTLGRGVFFDGVAFSVKHGKRLLADFGLVNAEFFFGKCAHISQ